MVCSIASLQVFFAPGGNRRPAQPVWSFQGGEDVLFVLAQAVLGGVQFDGLSHGGKRLGIAAGVVEAQREVVIGQAAPGLRLADIPRSRGRTRS